MPFYVDSQYNTPVLVPLIGLATGTAIGTGTAVSNALTVVNYPTFIRRTAVRNVQVTIVTAPNGGFTGGTLAFLNGTNTFAVVTIGTLTAGQVASGVITTANNTFAAASAMTGSAVGTVTSAGVAGGVYAIWLDQQELYA